MKKIIAAAFGISVLFTAFSVCGTELNNFDVFTNSYVICEDSGEAHPNYEDFHADVSEVIFHDRVNS